MTPLPAARRRAERFDSLVEGARNDDLDAGTRHLLELVGDLRSVPEPQARPEFVADLRTRLLLAAETELAATPQVAAREDDTVARLTVRPSRTRRERRLRVALGAAALVGATTSMAVASQGALPGDTLYPVKRAIENTEAGFSVGDGAKGETILGNASGRLTEVQGLTQRPDADPALVAQTLDTFSAQAQEAGDLLLDDYEQHGHQQSIRDLQTFTGDSVQTLSDLATTVTGPAHTALQNAAQVVLALDAQANNLCPTCGEPITEVPPQLLAGAAEAAGSALDQVGGLAGGVLPGTTPTQGGADPSDSTGSGQDKPSGLNPPENPVTIPPTLPSSVPSSVPTPTPSDDSAGLGDLLPTLGSGHHGGKGKGGGGGKDPVDLTPVTDTVDQVVSGVVQGVTDVLSGLTGGGTGP